MADNDLKEFERSLRQLEFIADASEKKRKPATRNQERTSPTNEEDPLADPQQLTDGVKSQENIHRLKERS